MLGNKAIQRISPTERLFSRPSWADPEFLMYSSLAENFVYTIQTINAEVIIGADPKRWAVGFALPDSVIAIPKISPMNDPLNWGEGVSAGIRGNWYTIFNYGPIVCTEWYIQGTPPQQVRVWTLEIQ